MADLMKGTYSYAVLSNKYGNFCVPSFKIKVGGTDLAAKLNMIVSELTVTLSLYAASTAIIKIVDIYDEKRHTFDSSIKSKFKLGTIVEIELGYLSKTTMIFKGYVAMLGVEFDEFPRLTIQLMDARRLMMCGGSKQLLHQVKNYSDAFKTIIGTYSSLCTAEIDATNDKLEKPLSQTADDYHFITQELIKKGKAPREFFILGGKAYFRTPAKEKSAIMTVQYGRELIAFSMLSGYLNKKIQVMGYDYKTRQNVSASATAKSTDSQSSVLSSTPVLFFADPDADSQEKAKTRATELARQELQSVQTASGQLLGLPEIVPGRFIKIEQMDALANKKYYITEVTHTIDTQTFTTSFEAGGYA